MNQDTYTGLEIIAAINKQREEKEELKKATDVLYEETNEYSKAYRMVKSAYDEQCITVRKMEQTKYVLYVPEEETVPEGFDL